MPVLSRENVPSIPGAPYLLGKLSLYSISRVRWRAVDCLSISSKSREGARGGELNAELVELYINWKIRLA